VSIRIHLVRGARAVCLSFRSRFSSAGRRSP
jgi:hypothetical protein